MPELGDEQDCTYPGLQRENGPQGASHGGCVGAAGTVRWCTIPNDQTPPRLVLRAESLPACRGSVVGDAAGQGLFDGKMRGRDDPLGQGPAFTCQRISGKRPGKPYPTLEYEAGWVCIENDAAFRV
jgi:hypothetical protein